MALYNPRLSCGRRRRGKWGQMIDSGEAGYKCAYMYGVSDSVSWRAGVLCVCVCVCVCVCLYFQRTSGFHYLFSHLYVLFLSFTVEFRV